MLNALLMSKKLAALSAIVAAGSMHSVLGSLTAPREFEDSQILNDLGSPALQFVEMPYNASASSQVAECTLFGGFSTIATVPGVHLTTVKLVGHQHLFKRAPFPMSGTEPTVLELHEKMKKLTLTDKVKNSKVVKVFKGDKSEKKVDEKSTEKGQGLRDHEVAVRKMHSGTSSYVGGLGGTRGVL